TLQCPSEAEVAAPACSSTTQSSHRQASTNGRQAERGRHNTNNLDSNSDMKNPASLSGLPPLLLVVIAWACVVGAVGVEGVAGGASQDSWGSCKTPVCGEVQRQAEALINLRLFRRYIAQTTENFNFITKDDVRDVLTDNPVEAESTTTQQIHDSHHINKVDQTEGQPYNSDEDSSPTTQQSEDYDTEDESQHLPATKHTTASGVSRNDLLELHGGSGKALIEHSSPKDV
ncbi:hypothetical protein OTU49_015985, partial [Cherax quadricarinatus]